ncbi:MAG: radical SAM protein [Candidatus Omnitrophota bacterium]|nr:radical SAM protein [Candidatus Omnitrophota bacterium]
MKFLKSLTLPEFSLWNKMREQAKIVSFNLELTGRCNHNCRHCYINLPAQDQQAKAREFKVDEIAGIAEQAVSLGALWCLLTGGEPLLREDFFDIYLSLKKKGLLLSVFTNAALITDKHLCFFKKYPPRDIEITVYGVTQETYEKVTRKPGSFANFTRGLDLLLASGIKVRLKAMVLRSNVRELPEISRFCRGKTKDFFRFDPFLHLRFDGDAARNAEIKTERLAPEEIVALENSDPQRFKAMEKDCAQFIFPESSHSHCNHLFHCGAGQGSFTVSYDGFFRLCSSLWHQDCIGDLRKVSLTDAWSNLVLKVRDMRSDKEKFLKRCRICPIINLCLWCPAHAHLETQEMDSPVEYFCAVAHARAKSLKNN